MAKKTCRCGDKKGHAGPCLSKQEQETARQRREQENARLREVSALITASQQQPR